MLSVAAAGAMAPTLKVIAVAATALDSFLMFTLTPLVCLVLYQRTVPAEAGRLTPAEKLQARREPHLPRPVLMKRTLRRIARIPRLFSRNLA
jgi:hypothetical protein